MRLAALLILVIGLPLGAQDFGFHTATVVRRGPNDLAHGLGASLAGSFRLGDILADSSLARKASLRLGARVALSETGYGDTDYRLCIDFCPPAAHDVSVRARMTKITLFALPLASPTARLDIGGGVAMNHYTRTVASTGDESRDGAWSFVASLAGARRIGTSPLWLQLEYTKHGAPPIHIADGRQETPDHSVNIGVVYRFADRRR